MNRAKKTPASQNIQRKESNGNESQPGPSSQANQSLRQYGNRSSTRNKLLQNSQDILSQNVSSQQNMQVQEKMQMTSGVIKYLLMADRNKHPILKSHIIKNIQCNAKDYQLIMKEVETQLFMVFGYRLIQVEGNKYIMVNEVNNYLPHLNFKKSANTQTLLFLVLVHIFMIGESSKEVLWDFLRNLGIVTQNNYVHEYFGDVKQLVTVDFVNQRYLEKIIPDKNDPTKVEYKWGCRALNEITFRSALEFVATIYDMSLNKWKLQHKAVKEQERLKGREAT
ncbi:PREDICTED: melanoma-associated antigen G1-like isoform X2 [Dinoponera quadriceps]|uniref:Melanoma-associated antigen G1-like isoform X2 n=1 Tax=Dinoponera quadriceps TaxID=609295 RepID=A0A6P3XXG4_DINQU|nr:PREDICTED: melanoma-associated antigen G1-like isoform X2 [Dinoponera quadriceps]